jgi:histidinol phosphatase-like enzyme
VVLVMGMPAAGKSAIAREFIALGYERLNRDERGGTLSGLVKVMDDGLAAGRTRWVLDNTYASRKSRNEVVECAWKHGAPVRCIHLTTSLPDAQINAVTRLLEIHGRLPMPEELRTLGKLDPRYFGPDAQFRYERSLEPPSEDEGFESIERRAFVRRTDGSATARAVFLEFDGVLVRSAAEGSPPLRAEDIALVAGAREALQQLHGNGWLLFAQAWRPQVARDTMPRESVDACFTRARELLGVDISFAACVHDAGPPICWCRKPLPGLVLEFSTRRGVSLAHSFLVGRSPADRTLAARLGLHWREELATRGVAWDRGGGSVA